MSDSSVNATSNWSDAKQRLLARRLSVRGGGNGLAGQGIVRRPNSRSGAALSYAQERLWFLDQLEPGSPRYNMPAMVRMIGRLDVEALGRSFDEIIRRHESLRTVFESRDGVPVQVIKEPYSLGIKLTDLENGQGEPEEELERIARGEGQRGFDLSEGPLIRARLVKVSSREHVLIVVMHHIVSDGWSIGVLIGEMRELYGAYVEGREVKLKELEVQYADWAVWQRETLKGEELERQLDYWREQLKGAPEVMELAADRGRPAVQSNRGATERIKLSEELSEKLREMSRGEGVTLFMLMLAAFKVLLYRYSGQEEIVVGTPIANRGRREVEGLIGFFVNTLVMRTGMGGEPSFRELLNRVKEVALGAYGHQDLPFEKLVEELRPERDLSHTPLFQVMFVLQNAPASNINLTGLTISAKEIDRGSANVDLLMCVELEDQEMSLLLEYSTDLFDSTTIKRMLGHFNELLQDIVANADKRISELNLIPAAELKELSIEWDKTQCVDESDKCIHALFEEQAESNPEALAIIFEGRQCNYAELNVRSNQVAHGLRGAGVDFTRPIAVMLESAIETIAVLLGILKAGGFFACINPYYPTARLTRVLEDADPPCLLTDSAWMSHHQALVEQYRSTHNSKIIVIDQKGGDRRQDADESNWTLDYFHRLPETNLEINSSGLEPCYVVYTSGSTGEPKGIVQSHRSFCQFLQWQSKQFSIRAGARISQWSSIAYDAAYCEVFGALCYGATVCLATPETKSNPALAIEWIERDELTQFQTVPGFCTQIVELLDSEKVTSGDNPFSRLKFVLLAGEVLPVSLARRWLDHFPNTPKLFNLYGPTESILAASYAIGEVRPRQGSIPVGHAIDGRQILILDKHKQLCPIGVKGEVYVRSPYLTKGYFRRPEQTRRVFMQNPLHDEFPDPTYRVGDLGRWLSGGDLEFCGRIDNQVKIRGMRVELEDIESALLAHPMVAECAVALRNITGDEERLVSYLVPKRHTNGSGMPAVDPGRIVNMPTDAQENEMVAQLREFAKTRLPQHMVPSIYVVLDDLPRTGNGKINRPALPEPAQQHCVHPETGYVAPQTELEISIANTWKDLLNRERIGVHDDFFDLGGHSLLATRVVNKLRETYSVDLSLRSFFGAPTIASLARSIIASRNAALVDLEKVAEIVARVKGLSADQVKTLIQEERASR